jgi:chitinase
LFDAYKAENPCCKDYIITGAPQCPRPDDNMSNMINKAKFDIIWPQFYNNGPAGCTARDWVNGEAGFNFADWASDLLAGESKDAKLYLGLLGGASGSAGSPGDYLTPTEAKSLIAAFESSTAFGGVMLWDAVSSFDSTNSLTSYKFTNGTSVPSGAAYYDVIKNYLEVYATSYTPTPSVCSSTTSSSSSSSSSTSTSSSTITTSSAAATTTSSSSSSMYILEFHFPHLDVSQFHVHLSYSL